MSFTLHQLEVFAAVVEHGSMTNAAKKLHMSQPAVSIQVKKLQEHFGAELLEVIGKKVYLTEAGNLIYNSQKKIENELKTMDMALNEMKGLVRGKLNIVVVSTAKYFMPYILGAFRKKYSDIQILLKVTDRIEVVSVLKQNKCDLAVFSQLPDELAIESTEFLPNPLVIAASPEMELTDQKNIQFKDLEGCDFLIREAGSGTRMVMENLFRKHDIKPRIVMELSTNEAVKQAIMAGIGISLISRYSINLEEKMGRISILDVKGMPYVNSWKLVYPKGKKLNPVAKSFLEFATTEDIREIIS